jgi:hypothetical protein
MIFSPYFKNIIPTTSLSLVPLLFLSGCGGGSSSGGVTISPTATPVATTSPTPTATSVVATATPASTSVPTPEAGAQHSAIVDFGNGQTGTLNLRVSGSTVSGGLVVNAAGRQTNHAGHSGPHPFTSAIVAGTYPLTGTFSTPDSFFVSGRFPDPQGEFAIIGTVPTATTRGSYTLACRGEGATGPIIFSP